MSVFHDRLRALRNEKGWTQAELAQRLQIEGGKQVISAYERKQEPSYDALVDIAKLFDVTTDYLLGATNEKTHENVSIHEITGLSDNSISTLRFISMTAPEYTQIINDLICSDEFQSLLLKLSLYLEFDPDKIKDLWQRIINNPNNDLPIRIPPEIIALFRGDNLTASEATHLNAVGETVKFMAFR